MVDQAAELYRQLGALTAVVEAARQPVPVTPEVATLAAMMKERG